jgi:hypothetical protein
MATIRSTLAALVFTLLCVASACGAGSSGSSGAGGMIGAGGSAATGSGGAMSTGGTNGGAGMGGGSGGAGDGGTPGGSSGGSGGSGGAAGADASGAGGTAGLDGGSAGAGGATSCAGNALSLSTNGFLTGTTGPNNDSAAARVDVDFGASPDLPLGNSTRTVEYWAYVPSTNWVGNANTMFFYGSTARPAHGFGLDFGASAVTGMPGNHATLDPFTNGGFDDDSPNYIGLSSMTSQWVHLAMTWDGTAVRTFVNGAEVITKTGDPGVTALNTDRSPIAIGGYEQDGNYFSGYIDEFRVWNVAHTAAQIAATMKKTLSGNELGLVLYLKFDEASGTNAGDSTTASGHTAHPGVLRSANGMLPIFIKSTAPIACP